MLFGWVGRNFLLAVCLVNKQDCKPAVDYEPGIMHFNLKYNSPDISTRPTIQLGRHFNLADISTLPTFRIDRHYNSADNSSHLTSLLYTHDSNS